MNKFYLFGLTDGSGGINVNANNSIQAFRSATVVNSVFVCDVENKNLCPINPDRFNFNIVPSLAILVENPNKKGQYKEIKRLYGAGITVDAIGQVLQSNLETDFSMLFAGSGGNGIIPSDTEKGGPLLGFPLFDLPFDFPSWYYLIIGVVSTYKAAKARRTIGKTIWGTLGAVSWANYANKSKK